MDKLFEKLPPRVLAVAAIVILMVVSAMLIYAIFDNRTVELWPPKIHARGGSGSGSTAADDLVREFLPSMLAALRDPMIAYEQVDSTIKVIAVNQGAADFYVARPEDLFGQSPVRLHEMIKPRIENFKDWAAEQMERISRASRPCGTIGTTAVPMQLRAGHPTHEGAWVLTSGCFEAGGRRWVITKFDRYIEGSIATSGNQSPSIAVVSSHRVANSVVIEENGSGTLTADEIVRDASGVDSE